MWVICVAFARLCVLRQITFAGSTDNLLFFKCLAARACSFSSLPLTLDWSLFWCFWYHPAFQPLSVSQDPSVLPLSLSPALPVWQDQETPLCRWQEWGADSETMTLKCIFTHTAPPAIRNGPQNILTERSFLPVQLELTLPLPVSPMLVYSRPFVSFLLFLCPHSLFDIQHALMVVFAMFLLSQGFSTPVASLFQCLSSSWSWSFVCESGFLLHIQSFLFSATSEIQALCRVSHTQR